MVVAGGVLVDGSGADGEEDAVLVVLGSEVLVRRLVAGVVCSLVPVVRSVAAVVCTVAAVVCTVVAVVCTVAAVVCTVVAVDAGMVIGVNDGALIDDGALIGGTVTDPGVLLGGTVTVVVLSVADGPGVLTAGTESSDDDGAGDSDASPAAPPRLGTVTVGPVTGCGDVAVVEAVLAGAGGLGSAVLAVPQAATASTARHSTAVVDERSRRRARMGPQCQAKGPRPRQHVEDQSTSRLE